MRLTAPTVLLAALVLAGCAGNPNGPGDGPPGGRHEGGGAGLVVGQIQEQLRTTADALKLKPTQVALWDAYQEKVGALMADQMKIPPYRAGRQAAPQQIAQKVDIVRNRLAAMEDIQESANKLYAALDDEQKKTADSLLPGTVPALYSGLGGDGGSSRQSGPGNERNGPGGRRGPDGGMGGSPGGFGRM